MNLLSINVYVLYQCMDWSGVVWTWRDVSLTVGGAMRSVRWGQTVVNHARVIQSDACTDAETVPKIHHSFIHLFIDRRFIIALFSWNLQRCEKTSLVIHVRWCHISLNKKLKCLYILHTFIRKKKFVRHFWWVSQSCYLLTKSYVDVKCIMTSRLMSCTLNVVHTYGEYLLFSS